MLFAAAASRPERFHLGDDQLAEFVAGLCEGEGRMGVQALEPAGARLAADPARKLGPQAALFIDEPTSPVPSSRAIAAARCRQVIQ